MSRDPRKTMARGNRSKRLMEEIARYVMESPHKAPVRDVVETASARLGFDKATVRGAIRQLVTDGTLTYTHLFGMSILEASFGRAVRISDRIVVKPSRIHYRPRQDDVVIEMVSGTAFGEGRHPTTRLVLGALDSALGCRNGPRMPLLNGLDVGTGTGILAIAMARLGVQHVLGTDIDPCALSEARHNALLNALGDRVTIEDRPLKSLKSGYGVLSANLAFPTIKRMATLLVGLTAPTGIIILSGFRASALPAVRRAFRPLGVVLKGQTTEQDWACTTWCKCSGEGKSTS